MVEASQVQLHVAEEGRHFQFVVRGDLSLFAEPEAVLHVDLPAVQFGEVEAVPVLQHADRPHEVNLVLVHSARLCGVGHAPFHAHALFPS